MLRYVCLLIFFNLVVTSVGFGGPVVAFATPEMRAYLDLAFRGNLNLKALESQAEAANQAAASAGFLPDPVIQSNVFLKPIETRLGAQKANVVLTQALPWPGKTTALEAAGIAKAREFSFRLQDARRTLKDELYAKFYQGYYLERRLALNKSQGALLETMMAVAVAQVRVGSGSQQDAAQAALEQARLAQDTSLVRRDLNTLRRQISTLLGAQPSAPVKFPVTLAADLEAALPPPATPQALSATVAQHPRLLLARAASEVADSQKRLAELSGMPDIKLSLSWFAIDESSAMTPSEKNEDAYAIGAALSLPVWWQKYSGIEAAAVSASLARHHRYADEMQRLTNEYWDLLGRYQSAQEQLTLFQERIVPQSEQIFLSNQSAYQQGTVTFDRVIADFRGLLQAKIGLHKQIAEFHTTRAHLERILGIAPVQSAGQTEKGS